MDRPAQQLIKLAELLGVSAGVVRDLMMTERSLDDEAESLDRVADELERLSAEVKRIGQGV